MVAMKPCPFLQLLLLIFVSSRISGQGTSSSQLSGVNSLAGETPGTKHNEERRGGAEEEKLKKGESKLSHSSRSNTGETDEEGRETAQNEEDREMVAILTRQFYPEVPQSLGFPAALTFFDNLEKSLKWRKERTKRDASHLGRRGHSISPTITHSLPPHLEHHHPLTHSPRHPTPHVVHPHVHHRATPTPVVHKLLPQPVVHQLSTSGYATPKRGKSLEEIFGVTTQYSPPAAAGYPKGEYAGSLENVFGITSKYSSPKPDYVHPTGDYVPPKVKSMDGHPFSLEHVFELGMPNYYKKKYPHMARSYSHPIDNYVEPPAPTHHDEVPGYPKPAHGASLEEIFGVHTKYHTPKPAYEAPTPHYHPPAKEYIPPPKPDYHPPPKEYIPPQEAYHPPPVAGYPKPAHGASIEEIFGIPTKYHEPALIYEPPKVAYEAPKPNYHPPMAPPKPHYLPPAKEYIPPSSTGYSPPHKDATLEHIFGVSTKYQSPSPTVSSLYVTPQPDHVVPPPPPPIVYALPYTPTTYKPKLKDYIKKNPVYKSLPMFGPPGYTLHYMPYNLLSHMPAGTPILTPHVHFLSDPTNHSAEVKSLNRVRRSPSSPGPL